METTVDLYRYKFSELFQKNANGSLMPKRVIQVNGITFGPGVSFGQGVDFGGVNLFQYQLNDVAVEENNGVLTIKGFYNQ